ncbi:MAG: DUF502 domain-containing protein [bacterium]|nr:DUF502 domain-containing protein [bacterium]
MRRVRKWLLTGLAVTLPTAITVWVLWKLFVNLDTLLQPVVERGLGFRIPGLGVMVAFLLLVIVGFLAGNFIVRKLIQYFESLAGSLPLAGKIYTSIRQILDVFFGDRKNTFRSVVTVQYPRPGLWALGFISCDTPPDLHSRSSEPCYNVFLPTSPNPTSGFVLIVPESELIHVELSVEEALKIIVSGGAYIPPEFLPQSDEGPTGGDA